MQRARLRGSPQGWFWKGSAALVLLAIMLTFSPVFWYVADPLVVSTPLTEADAIIVLGGGVLHNGRPSNITLERTLYGIALYRQGLARKMILSTGVVEMFNEARMMEEIARAHGVPQDAIILEESSRNTYENIRFVQQILKERGWNRVVLVSSPYHMKRVSLIYQKCCWSVTVLYAPAQPSWFYQGEGILYRLRQAQVVIREYVGIGWYWINGYL